MTKHIGIVACSAEGAALCYRTICIEGQGFLGKYGHPEVSMHTHPFSEYMKHIDSSNWEQVAELMISSSEKLAGLGADFCICPDNTIHQVFEKVIQWSKLPWLHIAEEVASEATRKNYKCLGILGTKYLMEGPVYPGKLKNAGINYIVPGTDERKCINEIIFNELINGIFTDKSRSYFTGVIQRLKSQNCDAVVLGCTEIPLIVTRENSPLPVLDSTRLLARAALKKAIK
jgi:aspartate racemase